MGKLPKVKSKTGVTLKLLLSVLTWWSFAGSAWSNAGDVDADLLRSIESPDCTSFLRSSSLSLSDYADWKIFPSNKLDSITFSKVNYGNRSCLELRVRGDSSGDKTTIALESKTLSSKPYSSVEAVSLNMKGGVHGRLRVVLRDSRGSLFASKNSFSTAFEGWTNFRVPSGEGAVQYFGKVQTMVPPIFIEKLVVILPEFKGDASLLVSKVEVWSRTEDFRDEGSVHSRWFGDICSESTVGLSGRQVMKLNNAYPIRVGNTLDILIDAHGLNGKSMSLDLAHYGYGRKAVLEKVIGKKNERISYKLKMVDPGLYAVISTIYTERGDFLDRTSQQVLVWDPPGNKYDDNVPAFFGMMYHDRFPDKRQKDLDLMMQAGIKVIRFPFRWSDVEQHPGIFSWTAYDGMMTDLRSRAFIAQPMVFYTPKWAGRLLNTPEDKELALERPQWIAPGNPNDLAEFIAAVAKRYAGQPAVWEVWNEPTEAQHWIGGDQYDYMEALRAVCGRFPVTPLGGVNSAGMVGLGAMSTTFAEVVARQSCPFDTGYAVHAYNGPDSVELNVRKVLKDLGECAGDKAIWVNEAGYLVGPFDPIGEIIRSENMIKMFTVARYHSAANLTWFIYRNYAKSALSAADNYSIVAYDETIRPPLAAYAGLVKRLVGTTPIPLGEFEEGISRYDFQTDEGVRIVLWADKDRNIAIPEVAGGKVMVKCDMFDFCEDVSPSELVSVGSSPIFLHYVRQ